jgi:hypothetical protein
LLRFARNDTLCGIDGFITRGSAAGRWRTKEKQRRLTTRRRLFASPAKAGVHVAAARSGGCVGPGLRRDSGLRMVSSLAGRRSRWGTSIGLNTGGSRTLSPGDHRKDEDRGDTFEDRFREVDERLDALEGELGVSRRTRIVNPAVANSGISSFRGRVMLKFPSFARTAGGRSATES